jgi:hypothetical protein
MGWPIRPGLQRVERAYLGLGRGDLAEDAVGATQERQPASSELDRPRAVLEPREPEVALERGDLLRLAPRRL